MLTSIRPSSVSQTDGGVADALPAVFAGYRRRAGRPGIRNYLLVLNATGLTEPVARRVHHALAGSVFVSSPYGMGMLGADLDTTVRSLFGLALHPNVGAVVVLSADRSRCDEISETLSTHGTPYFSVALDEVGHDTIRMAELAIRHGARLAKDLSVQVTEQFPLSDLFLALECGLSDPTSGIVANRMIGKVADMLVDAGATVVAGETLEWLGVEDALAARGATADISAAIRAAVLRRESIARDAGVDLLGVNPNRANIESGLTTIEEKASGSAAKTGTRVINGVLKYGEAPQSAGLYLMDAPSYTPESLTGFAASGAQCAVFSTGLGNSYVSALMPTVKITANRGTAERLPQQIDFDCSGVLVGDDQNAVAQALLREILSVASGSRTFGEILGEGGECISRFGESL